MFLVGVALNPQYLRERLKVAVVTSHLSILLPGRAWRLAAVTLLYPANDSRSASLPAFTLVIGEAMSITAFPVLARIVTERQLQGTPLSRSIRSANV